jgi:hypothetical protein
MSNPGKPVVLDPTAALIPLPQRKAPRPATLAGRTVGLLANDKRNAEELLSAIYDVLAERFELAGARRMNKGNASRPAAPGLLDDLSSSVDVVITANGD